MNYKDSGVDIQAGRDFVERVINKALGKTPYRLTQDEIRTNEYRVKKGLLEIPFAKNHAKKEKEKKKKK